VIPRAALPAEKAPFQQRRVEPIGLGPAMFARDRDAVWVGSPGRACTSLAECARKRTVPAFRREGEWMGCGEFFHTLLGGLDAVEVGFVEHVALVAELAGYGRHTFLAHILEFGWRKQAQDAFDTLA
jgi:hypothetical protein